MYCGVIIIRYLQKQPILILNTGDNLSHLSPGSHGQAVLGVGTIGIHNNEDSLSAQEQMTGKMVECKQQGPP